MCTYTNLRFEKKIIFFCSFLFFVTYVSLSTFLNTMSSFSSTRYTSFYLSILHIPRTTIGHCPSHVYRTCYQWSSCVNVALLWWAPHCSCCYGSYGSYGKNAVESRFSTIETGISRTIFSTTDTDCTVWFISIDFCTFRCR